jgi:hypothetical protein
MSRLDNTWKERVEEVEKELKAIKAETAQLTQQLEELKRNRNQFAVDSKAEKQKIHNDMNTLQAEAAAHAKTLAQAEERKAKAQQIIDACQREYEIEFMSMKRQIEQIENEMNSREIPTESLTLESELWGSEEESLRQQMKAIEREILEQRNASEAAKRAANEEKNRAEREVHNARMERDAEEGKGPFVFSDSIVAQYPDLFRYSQDAGSRFRKGRSASGRIIQQEQEEEENDEDAKQQQHQSSRLPSGRRGAGKKSKSASHVSVH